MKADTTKRSSGSRIVWMVALVCLVVAVITMILTLEQDGAVTPVTMADLNGVWTTPDSHYQDRFLQFHDGTITFGWGAEGMGSYVIDAIDSEPAKDGVRVHIRYKDLAANAYQFNFLYTDQGGGLIRMKNQDGVYWSHTDDRPIHAPNFK